MRCSNFVCTHKKMTLKKWYKAIANALDAQALPRKSTVRIQRLKDIVSDFTGKSISNLDAIEYLLKKGSRNDLYYLLKKAQISL